MAKNDRPKGNDSVLSPVRPYTGDGKTTRDPYDRVKLDKPAKK